MEQNLINSVAMETPRKRKRLEDQECESRTISQLDELNQDLLEKILSWLPASSFFRLRSVCKRWSSVATSATFLIACSQIPIREPWLFMVGPELDQSVVVFDTSEGNWKNLDHPYLPRENRNYSKFIPVASSGGLVCFRAASGGGEFIVCNPVTGACRELPPPGPDINGRNQTNIHAIAMTNSSPKDPISYKLVLVSGDFPSFSVQVYDSGRDRWDEEVALIRKKPDDDDDDDSFAGEPPDMAGGDETVYFLSKTGDVVVATGMQRSQSKQYSSSVTTTVEGGEDVVTYFLSSSGAVVACNLAQRCFSEYPRVLPVYLEHSIDVVECMGEMLVVVLSEFLESASLRVWKFSSDRSWHQVAAMPPSMSHKFYGKKADINCVGHGDMLFICVNYSSEFGCYVTCNLTVGEWSELAAGCHVNGRAKVFMSAFSFEPRVEACV